MYEWNPETAAQKLGPTLRAAWFSEALTKKLAYSPMDEAAALTALGAYVTLYRRGDVAVDDPAAAEQRAGPVSAWG